jgi:hypothetical protein
VKASGKCRTTRHTCVQSIVNWPSAHIFFCAFVEHRDDGTPTEQKACFLHSTRDLSPSFIRRRRLLHRRLHGNRILGLFAQSPAPACKGALSGGLGGRAPAVGIYRGDSTPRFLINAPFLPNLWSPIQDLLALANRSTSLFSGAISTRFRGVPIH